jgi:anaerobic selenocysteine-containing dehydrogenase
LGMQKKQIPIRPYDSIVRTTCPSCGAGCGLKVFLRGDQVVEIYGDEENQLNKGALCPRALMAPFHLYHEKRLLTPLLRDRLSESFRQATWEEALDTVVQKILKTSQDSPESLFIHLTPHAGFGHMALGSLFGQHLGTPNIDSDLSPGCAEATIVLRHMLGVFVNGCAMSSRHEWSSSQAILLAGVDPATTDPISFGPILDAKDRGTQLIVLDSRNTVTMSKAHLPLCCKVGTEPAVLFAMAHVLLRENLYDREFLERWVTGGEDFQALCQDYSPNRVEELSGVRQEDIHKAARIMAKNFPSMLIGHSRVSSRSDSAGFLFALVALATLTGTIGCPGGGVNWLENFPPIEIKPAESAKIPLAKESLVKSGNGSRIWRAVTERKPYPIRGMIWDTDSLSFCPEGKRVSEALRKMDLVVHLGHYPNETYHHAHVVFPLTTFLETEGLVFPSVGRNVQWANRVVLPRGECRPAEDFWGGLMARLNFSSFYPFVQETGRVNIREMTRFFLQQSPLLAGITPELLDPEKNLPGGIQWPASAENIDFPDHRAAVRGGQGLFRPGTFFPGTDKRFPTPSGKINLSPAEISKEPGFHHFGAPPHGGRNSKGKMLILVTGEIVDYMPAAGFWALPQPLQIPLFAQIHPQKARELGIQSGDRIILENERGKIEAPAWVTDQVDANTVFCPSGVDPYDPNFPAVSPHALFELIPASEGRGRRRAESTFVRVRRIS